MEYRLYFSRKAVQELLPPKRQEPVESLVLQNFDSRALDFSLFALVFPKLLIGLLLVTYFTFSIVLSGRELVLALEFVLRRGLELKKMTYSAFLFLPGS